MFLSTHAPQRNLAAGTRCPFVADVRARDVPSVRKTPRRGECVRLRAALEEETSSSILEGNPQFASVFKQSLARQGKSALNGRSGRNGTTPREERKPSAAEEILQTALQQSRQNLAQLQALKRRLEEYIIEEETQYDRLEFALQRTVADAAYIHTLQELREDEKQSSQASRGSNHSQYGSENGRYGSDAGRRGSDNGRYGSDNGRYGSDSKGYSWEEPESSYSDSSSSDGSFYEEEPVREEPAREEPGAAYDRWRDIRLR